MDIQKASDTEIKIITTSETVVAVEDIKNQLAALKGQRSEAVESHKKYLEGADATIALLQSQLEAAANLGIVDEASDRS